MFVRFESMIAVLVAAGMSASAMGAADAFRGIHVGFDTAAGVAGSPLLLRTGYGTTPNPGESENWAFRFNTISGQTRLETRTARYADNPNASWDHARYNLRFAAPATNAVGEGGGASPVVGWYAVSSLASSPVIDRQLVNNTGADAFVAAGRLTGGDFAWEILSVTPLNGSTAAKFAMGLMETTSIVTDADRRLVTTYSVSDPTPRVLDVFGVFDPALAGGGSLADRSAQVGFGNHLHGWGWFISERGEYEVALRAYDRNGVYAPTESYTFLVNSVPAPGCGALLGIAGVASLRRRR